MCSDKKTAWQEAVESIAGAAIGALSARQDAIKEAMESQARLKQEMHRQEFYRKLNGGSDG